MKTMSEKAIEMFATLLTSKLDEIQGNWQKPWFTKGCLALPKNLDGRCYNGANILLLMLVAQSKGYKLPYWATFNRISKIAKEKNVNLRILKGEKACPISLMSFIVKDKNDNRISYDTYLSLTEKEKKQYKLIPYYRDYYVFNVAQTNMQEVLPSMYEKLSAEKEVKTNGYSLEEADNMISTNSWLCPIDLIYQEKAYYSLTTNSITIPMKEQFSKGEEFYSTLFHEMTHSTHRELKREINGSFGSAEYGREELVAELTSLLVCTTCGIEKVTKNESCKYLKSWLRAIKEENNFLMTVLNDVKKAYSLIMKKLQTSEEEAIAA